MSCFHPLRGVVLGTIDGKKRLKVVPYDSIDIYRSDGTEYENFPLPCGHCVGCRSDQAKEWSNRLLMSCLYRLDDDDVYATLLRPFTYSPSPSVESCRSAIRQTELPR